MLAVAGADDQVTVWDLSLERDVEPAKESKAEHSTGDVAAAAAAVPPQLYFIHQGQQDVKEVRFHPQLPGVLSTTAASGFNIFKPCNM